MSSALLTNVGIFFLSKLALLPFKFIYGLSDCLYFMVYHVFDYRKNVIINNLKNSFPAKTDAEIKSIAKNFYRHLCDLMLESIKMEAMDQNDFEKRMPFKNPYPDAVLCISISVDLPHREQFILSNLK